MISSQNRSKAREMDSEVAEGAGRGAQSNGLISSRSRAAALDPTPWPALDLLPQSSAVALVFFLYHLLQILSQAAITSWPVFRSCVCIVVVGGLKSKDS